MDFAEVRRTNKALVKVARLYRGSQAQLLAEMGLHPGQDVLLWTLGQAPDGLLVSEIADRLGIESPTVTRTLARLESAGWFTREAVPGDRRAVRIQLTPRARDVLKQVEASWRTLAATATAGLDATERRQLLTLLEHVQANLRARGGDTLEQPDPASDGAWL